jgi:hypothetical protein
LSCTNSEVVVNTRRGGIVHNGSSFDLILLLVMGVLGFVMRALRTAGVAVDEEHIGDAAVPQPDQ